MSLTDNKRLKRVTTSFGKFLFVDVNFRRSKIRALNVAVGDSSTVAMVELGLTAPLYHPHQFTVVHPLGLRLWCDELHSSLDELYFRHLDTRSSISKR